MSYPIGSSRITLTSKDCALGLPISRGLPLWGLSRERAIQVENPENKYVPRTPPSLTSPSTNTLPHNYVVRCGEELRAPLGAGRAEEKVNLRPIASNLRNKRWLELNDAYASKGEWVNWGTIPRKPNNLTGSTRGAEISAGGEIFLAKY